MTRGSQTVLRIVHEVHFGPGRESSVRMRIVSTRAEAGTIAAKLESWGWQADATFCEFSAEGSYFGASYVGYSVTGEGQHLHDDRYLIPHVTVHHNDAKAWLEITPHGTSIRGLEDDPKPQSLTLLHRGRKIAEGWQRRGGRPSGTGTITGLDQVYRAIEALRGNGQRPTQELVAEEMLVDQQALKRFLRSHDTSWRDISTR